MPGKAGLLAVILPACILTAHAQRTGTTTLVLQVGPEARLVPNQVALNFRVSADGSSDVTSQTANIEAWVRALPGQAIRVTARVSSLNGPAGPLPATALRWSGSIERAAAGGQAASCSAGSFADGAAQDLVLGWRQSGIVGCTFTFELAAPRKLAPGSYSAVVDLAVEKR